MSGHYLKHLHPGPRGRKHGKDERHRHEGERGRHHGRSEHESHGRGWDHDSDGHGR